MLKINVSSDIKQITKRLQDAERKQIPFATAQALTATAKHARDALKAEIPSIFDNPTPFTRNAVAARFATKATQQAFVYIKPAQAAYLELEETGGFRSARSGKSLPEPIAMPLNQYGNIPRKKIAQLAAKPGYFVGTVKGITGLWQRPKKSARRNGGTGTVGALNTTQGFKTGLKLVARFVRGWSIKPKFHFTERVAADVRKTLPGEMRKALDKALASKKP